MINYLIGIDGGGTKTEIAAITCDGKIIEKVVTGPGSAAVVSEKQVWNDIEQGIEKTIEKIDNTKYQLVAIQMGLSAYSILEEKENIILKLQRKHDVNVYIDSDTVIALHSVLKDNYHQGVVVVAGTGVAIYGENKNEIALIGGWGHIIRELGSSYAAVHHFVLKIIDNMEDGIPLSPLEEDFLKLLKSQNIKDLKHLFYFHSKTEIASFVTFLKNKALEGNLEAKEVLRLEGEYLGIQVLKAIIKLNLTNDFVIGLRGGFVQKDSKDIVDGFRTVMRKNNINALVIDDDIDPVMGCYYLLKNKNRI